MRSLVISVALAFVAACGKGDKQMCDQACRNYAQLMYWSTADAELAKLPAEQREAAKKQKLAEMASKIENGIDFCVSKCQSANNDDQSKCLIDAKTAAAAKACTADD